MNGPDIVRGQVDVRLDPRPDLTPSWVDVESAELLECNDREVFRDLLRMLSRNTPQRKCGYQNE